MDLIPAIDVHEGRCVRLRQGEYSERTVYSNDPESAAASFLEAGAERLHVVDLDAARGMPNAASADAVARVVRRAVGAGCAVQVGGGVRSAEAARRWLDRGVVAVIVGSVAARAPELALAICRAAEERVLLSLDTRAGVARVQGWTEDGMAMTELLRRWRYWPVAGIVYTDTTRDGMLGGPNLAGLDTCRELYAGPVQVSGGISSIDDIKACAVHGAVAVVVGKAIYEKQIDLAEALRVVSATK